MHLFRKPKPAFEPQWMIVGLGNPGEDYRGTRHNVGFEVIDRLAGRNKIRVARGKHRALVGEGDIGGVAVALVKPLTYMNLSGRAVAPLARSYSLKPQRIIVVADDLDLPVGKVKLKLKGSAGGHNGHKSIIASLQSENYPRLKIGIGKVDRSETIDHVLSQFDPDELAAVESAIMVTVEACEASVARRIEEALDRIAAYNTGRNRDLAKQ